MTKEEFKGYLRPITQGLFGKPGTRRYQRPNFALRPLERMMRDLVAIPPEEWYRYAFSTEPLNGKFDDEKRRDCTVNAIACGREYARKMAAQYETNQPEQLARALGMLVSYQDYPEKTDRVLFAEFREPNLIRVYMDAVKRAQQQLEQPEVRAVLTPKLDVGALLLAHELFHYVEETHQSEIFTRTEKIELWHIGGYRYRSEVIAFGEIAAMAFAAELTGLPYSPYVMDVFLVYGYSPQEASGLYEKMMEYADRVPDPGTPVGIDGETIPPQIKDEMECSD